MKKINIYDILILFMIFYLYSTFFYKIFPKMNTLLGIPIILITIFIYMNNLKKNDIFVMFIIFYYVFVSILCNDSLSLFFEHTVHLVSTLMMLWKLTDKSITSKMNTSLLKFKSFIKFSLVLIVIINLLMLISGNFTSINTGNRVYSGLSNGSHSIASISCMALMMLMNVSLSSKMSNFFKFIFIGYIVIIIASGSRIYLLVLISILYSYYIERIKKLKYYKFYTCILIFICLFVFFNSNMFNRFVSTANNTFISSNKLEAMSSGRLIWWKYDLNEYLNLNFFSKIFGRGNEFVFDINEKYYGLHIWAHNDFIQVLISYGVFGIIFYLKAIKKAFANFYRKTKKTYSYVILGTIMGIASLNGFYTQQHMIFCVILMIMLQNKDLAKNGY